MSNKSTGLLLESIDIDQIAKSLIKESEKNKLRFPVDTFPKALQDIMNHFAEIKGYPIDYFGTAILNAIGLSIGNSHVLHTINGYRAKSNLFSVIIGRPGLNKSEPLSDAFRPIEYFVGRLWSEHADDLRSWQASSKTSKEINLKPFFAKPLLSDVTIESVALQLSHYQKGCGIMVDELSGLFNSFGKYSKGSGNDVEFYLSAWSNKPIVRDRVTSDPVFIQNPFLSIIGTTQPETADRIFSGKEESGFIDRWLICYPEGLKKGYPAQKSVDPNMEAKYKVILEKLLDFRVNNKAMELPTNLNYTSGSWEIVLNWVKQNTDIENNPNTTPTERGIRAKMDIYLHRFALIMQLAMFATGETSDRRSISEHAADSAVRIADYYLAMALKQRLGSKVDRLTGTWKDFISTLERLPENHLLSKAVLIKYALSLNIPERTLEDWLRKEVEKENGVLKKIKRGIYELRD